MSKEIGCSDNDTDQGENPIVAVVEKESDCVSFLLYV